MEQQRQPQPRTVIATRWLVAVTFSLTACARAGDHPAPILALTGKNAAITNAPPAPASPTPDADFDQVQPIPVSPPPGKKGFTKRRDELTQTPRQRPLRPATPRSTWGDLGKASWIAEGSSHPTRIVYVFTDTECPYCHSLWQAIQPMLAVGDVQVRDIIVAVIGPKSLHRAAAIFDAREPAAAFRQYESSFGRSTVKPESSVPAETARRIAANTALMNRLGVQGTPATVYRDQAGKIQIEPGMMAEGDLGKIFLD